MFDIINRSLKLKLGLSFVLLATVILFPIGWMMSLTIHEKMQEFGLTAQQVAAAGPGINAMILRLCLMIAVGASICGGIWFLIAARIVGKIADVQNNLAVIAETRDLTIRNKVVSIDEVGNSARHINGFLDVVERTMTDIRALSDTLNHAASEVERSGAAVDRNSNGQAAAIQELVAAIEQTAAMVRSTAAAAKSADDEAQSATSSSNTGQKQIDDVASAMTSIKTASDRIRNVIGLIEEIAFQTNLLALNAAVEAARAGENGRGFAVVATEVRQLAARSAKAAQESAALILDVNRQVERGVDITTHAAETFTSIRDGIDRVSNSINEISTASAEQSRAMDQISGAMHEVDRFVRDNTNEATALNRSVGNLRASTRKLETEVDRFRTRASRRSAA